MYAVKNDKATVCVVDRSWLTLSVRLHHSPPYSTHEQLDWELENIIKVKLFFVVVALTSGSLRFCFLQVLQALKHTNGKCYVWNRIFEGDNIGNGHLYGPFDENDVVESMLWQLIFFSHTSLTQMTVFDMNFETLTGVQWNDRQKSLVKVDARDEHVPADADDASLIGRYRPLSDGEGAEALFSATSLQSERRRRAFAAVPLADVRQFWNDRPCNLRHGRAPIGTREYFDQVEERKYRVEPHIRTFAEFERWRDCDVLEVGCGLGTETVNFARAGARIVAVDLSERSVELTRQRLQVMNQNATTLVADAESLTSALETYFEAQKASVPQFDLIWSFGVVHHTPHPARAVAEMAKLLKTGGELRLMVYSKVSYKLFFLMRETGVWDFSSIDQLIGEYSEAQSGCPVTYSYTAEELEYVANICKVAVDLIAVFAEKNCCRATRGALNL